MSEPTTVVEIHDNTISRLALRIIGAHPHTDPVAYFPLSTLLDNGRQLVGSAVDVIGWDVLNAAGGSLNFVLRDGASTNDTPVINLPLGAGSSARMYYGPQGVRFQAGLFVQVTQLPVSGSVFYRPARRR